MKNIQRYVPNSIYRNLIVRVSLVLSLFLFCITASMTAQAQEFLGEDIWFDTELADVNQSTYTAGIAEDTGTHFEVKDSAYLDITLESDKVITARVESIPEIISISLDKIPQSYAQLSLSGLESNTVYYKYTDKYEVYEELVSDDQGVVTFSQDLYQDHYIYIQPRKSTKILRDNTTGGDCTSIGIWSEISKTCTLTGGVYETIEIADSGITLDGAGHTIRKTGFFSGHGMYASHVADVTVKNLIIEDFSYGVSTNKVQNFTLSHVTVRNNSIGVSLGTATESRIAYVTAEQNRTGIRLYYSNNNIVEHNVIQDTPHVGLWSGDGLLVYRANNNNIQFNTITRGIMGVTLTSSSDNNFFENILMNFVSFLISIMSTWVLHESCTS